MTPLIMSELVQFSGHKLNNKHVSFAQHPFSLPCRQLCAHPVLLEKMLTLHPMPMYFLNNAW